MVIAVGDQTIELRPRPTGAWEKFDETEAGTVEIPQSGEQVVTVRSRDAQNWKPINLRWVKFRHVEP